MTRKQAIILEIPGDLDRLRLPTGVNARLHDLLDRQDQGLPLTAAERAEAEGLVDLADLLSLLRLRAERENGRRRNAAARPLSACLESVDTPRGRTRVAAFLQTQPYPLYEPHPEKAGFLVRTDADGKRTEGRFINRRFRPVRTKARKR